MEFYGERSQSHDAEPTWLRCLFNQTQNQSILKSSEIMDAKICFAVIGELEWCSGNSEKLLKIAENFRDIRQMRNWLWQFTRIWVVLLASWKSLSNAQFTHFYRVYSVFCEKSSISWCITSVTNVDTFSAGNSKSASLTQQIKVSKMSKVTVCAQQFFILFFCKQKEA